MPFNKDNQVMAGVCGYIFQSKATELAPPSGLEEEDDEDDELPEAALVTCSVAAAFAAFLAFHPIVRGMQN